jgi:predicted DNA-binding antitoxin AbrB/MazE fold protein
MIRAVFRDGVIQPLDPVPTDWRNGQELQVRELESGPVESAEELDAWYRELEALAAELNDPEEWERLEARLSEADQQAKGTRGDSADV